MDKKNVSISVIHTEWSDGWGGQEIRTIGEMLLMRDRGVKVYLSSRPHSQISQKANYNNISCFTLPFRSMFDLFTVVRLAGLVKKHQIKIINTHSGKDTWLGGMAAKISGVKFIRTRHLAHPINPSRVNFINELADYIITTGDTVRDAMIRDNRILPDHVTSIPTMPDHRKFSIDNYDIRKERARLGLKPNHLAVGIVGVLRSIKRHDLFIEMASVVHAKCPDTRFFIAGKGPQYGSLGDIVIEKNLTGIVSFMGHLDDPGTLMAALDIYVQTSDSETTTQTVPQALLMGLPVISTDVGSVRQNHKGDNFILVESGNVHQLADSVFKLVKNKSLREAYAKKARSSVPASYSAESMADQILEIYHRLLLH